MKPKIIWANHASYFVEYKGKLIVTDPWLFGSVFNNGWELVSKSPDDVLELFKKVDYIWISHEHPDHFFPPTLKLIPEERRKDVTILFHETEDKRVLKYCEKIGYSIMELKQQWEEVVKDEIYLYNEPNGIEDSWVIMKFGETVILNLNDCTISNSNIYQKIKNLVNGEIEVLLSQFSYAERIGNPDESHLRKVEAQFWLDGLIKQVSVLQPKYTIPFASYKFYSNKENFYMNDEAAKPWTAEQMINENKIGTPIVLYPFDSWTIGDTNDNKIALDKYKSDWDNLSPREYKTTTIDDEELLTSGDQLSLSIKNIFTSSIKIFNAAFSDYVSFGNIKFYLSDKNATLTFSLKDKTIIETGKDENWDIELHSESLNFVFRFPFGTNSLLVNGRFIANNKNAVKRLYRLSHFGLMVAANEMYSVPYLLKNVNKIVSTLVKRTKVS